MNKYLMPLIVLPLVFSQTVAAEQDTRPRGGKPNHFLKLFDGNGDGQVTEEEFNNAMQQRYQQMDADQDGNVSVDEFKRYSDERHKNWQQRRHGRMDQDKDGAVSKKEFIDRAIKRAEKRFARLDKNGDGMLSQDENIQHRAMKKKRLMKHMDANQDGLVSPEEHKAMTQRWFGKMDADNDKVIKGDELRRTKHR